jgi:hypothetical protein
MDVRVRGNFLAMAAGVVVLLFGAALDLTALAWLGAVIALGGFVAWQVNARRQSP